MRLFRKSRFKVERFEYFYDHMDDRGSVWWEINGPTNKRLRQRDLEDLRDRINEALDAEVGVYE